MQGKEEREGEKKREGGSRKKFTARLNVTRLSAGGLVISGPVKRSPGLFFFLLRLANVRPELGLRLGCKEASGGGQLGLLAPGLGEF